MTIPAVMPRPPSPISRASHPLPRLPLSARRPRSPIPPRDHLQSGSSSLPSIRAARTTQMRRRASPRASPTKDAAGLARGGPSVPPPSRTPVALLHPPRPRAGASLLHPSSTRLPVRPAQPSRFHPATLKASRARECRDGRTAPRQRALASTTTSGPRRECPRARPRSRSWRRSGRRSANEHESASWSWSVRSRSARPSLSSSSRRRASWSWSANANGRGSRRKRRSASENKSLSG